MASDDAVAAVLAFLHELFPTREVGAATLDAWSVVFAEWSDDELRQCAKAAAMTSGRTFFPTPGDIAACRVVPAVDGGAVLRRISALGTYNPHVGWQYPRLDVVRAALGDGVADAYATAGGEQCFAENTVTADIAGRAFAKELAAAQQATPLRPLLAPAAPIKQLAAGESAPDVGAMLANLVAARRM